MRARGHELRIFPGVYEKDNYLAGSDETRLNDLHAAFADPEVKTIICLRGGYGTPGCWIASTSTSYDATPNHS